MAAVKLTGVKDMKEDVLVTIVSNADNLSDEVAKQEGKMLAEMLVDVLPMGTIAYLADRLNEHLMEAISLMCRYEMLKQFAKSLGIEAAEDEK